MDFAAPRPTSLGGFWACLAGGVLLSAVPVHEHPIADPARCANAGAAGNASAFAGPAGDLYRPMLVLGRPALVVIEQAVPTTWRHRSASTVILRGRRRVRRRGHRLRFRLVPLETGCRQRSAGSWRTRRGRAARNCSPRWWG